MSSNQHRFVQLLNQHIVNTIQHKFEHHQLTPAIMREIRDSIQAIIESIFTKSKKYRLSDVGCAWLTNQFFKRINVNDQKMIDLIIINEYNLSQLTYSDIELLNGLFDQTDLAIELVDEHKIRRTS